MAVKNSDQVIASKIRARNYETALSPHAADLAIYIRQQQSIRHAELSADAQRPLHRRDTNFSDTERRNLEKEWMTAKLLNTGWTTKTGMNVVEFVKFIDLDKNNGKHRDAYDEVQAKRLPTKVDFYKLFAVMCHLNDKAMDPDKLCMPRDRRVKAIRQELNNPGTTDPPEGYASVSKACWSFEVKNNWTLIPDIPGCVAQKNKDGSTTPQYPLESAYCIIATNHIGKHKNGQIKHRSRDDTIKWVRGLDGEDGNESVTTQIIKDFVAACPGCNASPMRVSRQRGAETTRSQGGNREKRKEWTGSPKKRHAESDSEIHTSSPSKKRVVENPSQLATFDNQYPVDANPYNRTSNSASNMVQHQFQQIQNFLSLDSGQKSQVAIFDNQYPVHANPYNRTSNNAAIFDDQYPVDANPYNKASNNASIVNNQYPVNANRYNNTSNMVQQQDQQIQNFQSPASDQKSEQSEESSSIDSRLSNTDNSEEFDLSQLFVLDQNDQSLDCFAEHSSSLNLEDLVYEDSRWTYKTDNRNVHMDRASLVDCLTSIKRSASTKYGVFYQQ